jgi:hypothetical protein
MLERLQPRRQDADVAERRVVESLPCEANLDEMEEDSLDPSDVLENRPP